MLSLCAEDVFIGHQYRMCFINQFGFDRACCGTRMPAEMKFWDIRSGSDLEFGQSIYEPFGIAQLEALAFGSICVMSAVCGCAFFANKTAGPKGSPNVLTADYRSYKAETDTIEAYKAITREQREAFDHRVAREVAGMILERLPRSEEQKNKLIREGNILAHKMSWDAVARECVLPGLIEITKGS